MHSTLAKHPGSVRPKTMSSMLDHNQQWVSDMLNSMQ